MCVRVAEGVCTKRGEQFGTENFMYPHFNVFQRNGVNIGHKTSEIICFGSNGYYFPPVTGPGTAVFSA